MFEGYSTEIADHIRQHIGLRIADFVEHLLANRADIDDTSGIVRLGGNEAAIRGNFRERIAGIVHPVSDAFPVCEISACGLWPAFEDMAGETCSGQLVEIVARPAKFVDTGRPVSLRCRRSGR